MEIHRDTTLAAQPRTSIEGTVVRALPYYRYINAREGSMYVKDIMHTAVATVTPETRVSTAYQRMTTREARIRHLPVVTDGQTLVGILTDRDVRRAAASDARPLAEHELLYLLDKLCVRDIMT